LEKTGTLKGSTLDQSAETLKKGGWWWYEFKEGCVK